MKTILSLLVFLNATLALQGQVALKIRPGANLTMRNGAKMVINSASLKNDGSLLIGKDQGSVNFVGFDDTIQGVGNLLFDTLNVRMAPGGTLTLDRDIKVATSLHFYSGLFNLTNRVVDLETTGLVQGETEVSRAYTNSTGYLQSTQVLNAPNSLNPGNLGIIITSTANLGSTTIRRGHLAEPNLEGGSSIKRYFDIIPTNNKTLNATLEFRYFDAEKDIPQESSLALWRSTNTSWTVLGVNSIDTVANIVRKNNVQNFARFTLAQGCPTLQVTIPDVYTVQPGGAANTRYIGYGPGSITLTAATTGGAGPYSYRWTTVNGTVLGTNSSLGVTPSISTTYNLTVTDQFGCSSAQVSKTINVLDIRCGANLTNVTVCEKQKNGSFKTVCISSSNVAGTLSVNGTATGSYLGSCQTAPLLVAREQVAEEVHVLSPSELVVNARPNPSTNYFTLSTVSSVATPITVQIMDMLGRNVETRQGVPATGSLQLGDSYKPGVYIVQVAQGKQVVTIKLVKQ